MKLKKLDNLLAQNFLPPFVVTFFIALFVLVMQTLWLYIDDIAGKGIGFFLLVELVSYLSVSMIPMALPIAVLISSVMVLGNMAEQYELSSFKSAGVSLWRVMRPLIFISFGISMFSFFCSNNLIPISNLKFKSRLYDIRKQKPTLSMEEGMFNDDFQGYSIRIGSKDADNRTIKDVLLYDHSESSKGRLISVSAAKGEMYGTDDEAYFIMNLYDGEQYSEPKASKKEDGKKSTPFVRTSFEEWYKVFDLNEFELNRTDERLFKSHHTMLSSRQLKEAIDSINVRIDEKMAVTGKSTDKYFYFFDKKNKDEARKRAEKRRESEAEKKVKETTLKKEADKLKAERDTLNTKKEKPQPPKKRVINQASSKPPAPSKAKDPKKNSNNKSQSKKNNQKKDIKKNNKPPEKAPYAQTIEKELAEYGSIVELFEKKKSRELLDKGKTFARSIFGQADSAIRTLKRMKESKVKHIFEFHTKYSMAIACVIFLFIGAPMGAIVRKGGFGWPLLISIIFFMIFVVLTIFSKNIAERFVIDPILAAWVPCLVIFPIGMILTFQAMNDASAKSIFNFFNFFKR